MSIRSLALRAYLRAGASLDERWSWPQQRLSAYASTPEGKAAAADLDAVIAAFSSANPGFTLNAEAGHLRNPAPKPCIALDDQTSID